MTYKEFREWCEDRACDGRWGIQMIEECLWILSVMETTPFWKRRKKWKKFKPIVIKHVIEPWKEYYTKEDSHK